MSYDEEEQKRSRVVVETPTARREVVHQQTTRYPQERRGFSTGAVVTVALTAIAVTAILFLFLTNSRDDSADTNINIRASAQPTPFAQQPVIVSQPAPTPIIIQQPATTTQPAPVIIQAPPATTTAPPASSAPPAPNPNDDASLQQKLDRAFDGDAEVNAANIDATVVNGRVRLMGTVSSEAIKQRAELLAYQIKGVLGVDNKIVVSP
ncbi:MAG TPA: BON domain-containing protein [Pyrinomonadaceae bacterium]|nr:BON domain-containing protein [Pyrinomonadaceae bacterium]